MNVSFSGARKYKTSQNNIDTMQRIAYVVMGDSKVEKIYFGGAEGVDTEMLVRCGKLKNVVPYKKKLIAIVPNTIKDQPEFAQKAIEEYADSVIELKNPITQDDGYKSYRRRNEELVKKCDELYAFPAKKSHNRSGTWMTIRIAQKAGKEVLLHELEN
tara:strand:+ start:196 stop:669 length:474 start_codon:yes stop_codon:yes gene_type:complete